MRVAGLTSSIPSGAMATAPTRLPRGEPWTAETGVMDTVSLPAKAPGGKWSTYCTPLAPVAFRVPPAELEMAPETAVLVSADTETVIW